MPEHRLPISPRQEEILSVYRRLAEQGKPPPTMQELADEFGRAKITVYEHVNALIEKGFLVRLSSNVARGVVLADAVSKVTRQSVIDLLNERLSAWPKEAREAMIEDIVKLPEAP